MSESKIMTEHWQATYDFSPLQTHYPDDHEFFNYTSQRWFRDDNIEKRKRYVRFDVNALCTIAAKSSGATECVSLAKLDEGSFNRAFLLRLDDGNEVVARIPLPIAGPPHLLTASEVATLDFARNIMGIPAPKVLAWSSRAESNPVGSEYIILEKVGGMQFAYAMQCEDEDFGDKLKSLHGFVEQMVIAHKRFCNFGFSMYGSLFYKEDVVDYPHTTKIGPEDTEDSELTQRFAIGPHMSFHLWSDERKEMDIDRGPWKSPSEYIAGFIRCQQEWLRRYATRHHDMPCYISDENNDPKKHIAVLDDCLKMIERMIPQPYSCPTIWHPDLHYGNIFITKETPHSLEGIIDWQYTGLDPFLLTIKIPKAFRFSGTRVELVDGGSSCSYKMPDNFDELPSEEKSLVRIERFQAVMHAIYARYSMAANPRLQGLLENEQLPMITKPFESAIISWTLGLETLRMHLLLAYANWDSLADGECPLHFTEQEKSEIIQNFNHFTVYQSKVAEVCDKIGLGSMEYADADSFDATMAAITELESEWDVKAFNGPYPFTIEKKGTA